MEDRLRIYQTPCICYDVSELEQGEAICVCDDVERMIRARIAGVVTNSLQRPERRWCVWEADKCGEGYYTRDELEKMDDQDLCKAVLNAWTMYCQSQGLI